MSAKKEIICGIHPVMELLHTKSRAVLHVFIEEGKANPGINRITKFAKRANIKITRKDRKDLDRLSARNVHQGVVAFAEVLSKLTLQSAMVMDRKKDSVWLAVDEITDPQNLGSIVRSAACFGVEFVILPSHRTAGITPAVYKSACGALEKVNIVEVANLNWAILTLKEKGYWIYGADLKGKPINKILYNSPSVLVIGAEDKGIRAKTRQHCDELITISQTSKMQSLNASCATSVILYDMYNKTKLCKK